MSDTQYRLCITSQKGGVGKTTLALNLAYAMARRGWPTLLIDTDPQGGVGLSLSKRTAAAPGLAQYASGAAPLESTVIQTRLESLAVLPVGQLAVQDTPGFGAVLADGALLRDVTAALAPRFSLVLIDTPSGFTGTTLGALRASTHALAPVQAEPLAARSLGQLLEVLSALRAEGAEVQLLGLVLSMLQLRVDKSAAVAEELWGQLADRVLQTPVPRDAAFLEASAAGVPLGLLQRRPTPLSAAFEQLAAEVESRLAAPDAEVGHGPVPLVD